MIFIGIGSNKSNRFSGPMNNVKLALRYINNNRIKILSISSIYLTSPLLKLKQENYYNMVIEVDTHMKPSALLLYLHNIERIIDKRSMKKWDKRRLDLDLLCYKGLVIRNKTDKAKKYKRRFKPISLPHPELNNRLFNLKAIEEICPLWHHPKSKMKIGKLIKGCSYKNKMGGDILKVFAL